MAQAVGRPKAKSKNVVSVEKDVAVQNSEFPDYAMLERNENMWRLASDLLLQKAKLANQLTPSAVVEIANWAKLLDKEIYG